MGLFGGNCGCGGQKMDCCEIILILWLLTSCGCGMNFDCNTMIILLLLLTCGGCNNNCHDDCR